ncbi:MAG: PEGA domain-containing protein [Gammaproteobacteria bacterium]
MTRIYFIHDTHGERRLGEQDLPLAVGGAGQGGIVLPGLPATAVVAHIGLDAGHAFIQPAQTDTQLFHNHEHLTASKWLKSGDVVEVGASVIHWNVQGDQINISVQARVPAPELVPPNAAPPPVQNRTLPEVAQTLTPARGQRTLRWLVFGVFMLLLLAVAFVLLATPVAIRITPEPEHQSLQGFPPAVSIGGRQLVLPGRYTVAAERAGYRPLQETIEVTAGGFRLFELQLEELPGRVSIELQPNVPFDLFVNDIALATDSDGLARIPGGTHRLRIETARYLPVEELLAVAGRDQAQRVAHVLQPAWARVRIDSQPPGAAVQVNGKTLGVTPLETELLQGEHSLVLALEQYRDLAHPLQVRAGSDQVLDTFQLQPADGRLLLGSKPAGASVSVDGVYRGTTPLTLALASGVGHTVRLTKPGYQHFDKQLQLSANEEQSFDAQLLPQYGIVFVSAQPADATLRVDGSDAGKGTQRLQLTTRSHTLEFSKPGYTSTTVTVTPRAGTSQNIDITLVTAEQARSAKQAAAIPAVLTGPAGQQLHLVRPQGSFRMGASRREAGRRANESVRQVELLRPFYLASREVTNAEFRQFRPAHSSGSAEGMSLNADSQPVVNISWDDAARFCNWLSSRAGLPPAYAETDGRLQAVQPLTTGYRLPSEAEWAYVARKHTYQSEQRYPWSGSFPPTAVGGNFADTGIADTLANTVPDYTDGHRVSAPVGSFTARPAGFYDLGGNVSEWMHDYYAVYPGEAGKRVTDPTGPVFGEHHVVRDSSWRHGTITELRLSYRDYSRAPRPDLGFRVARYAE